MLQYYNPIHTKDDLTLSVDNVVIDFWITNPTKRDMLMTLLDRIQFVYTVNVTHWMRFKPGEFKEQFTIAMSKETSFWLGAGLNGRSTDWRRVRLDFNPNKVAHYDVFTEVLIFLIRSTKPTQRKIQRFDLAIDIPVDRSHCFLIKDNRAYQERKHGKEWTQYLGAKSSTVGRVKLYNKTVESNLNYPLSRLELTLAPSTPYEKAKIPKVMYLYAAQMKIDEFKATDTERFIANALLHGVGTMRDLGRRTQQKLEALMSTYMREVSISEKDYDKILRQVDSYSEEKPFVSKIPFKAPPLPLPRFTPEDELLPLASMENPFLKETDNHD